MTGECSNCKRPASVEVNWNPETRELETRTSCARCHAVVTSYRKSAAPNGWAVAAHGLPPCSLCGEPNTRPEEDSLCIRCRAELSEGNARFAELTGDWT